MSKAFSLIELIFAIIIVAILASIALPNFFNTSNKTSLLKVKTDLLLIQNGLNEYKNKNILKGNNITLGQLDNGKNLFSKILPNHNFINEKAINSWEKISNNKYNFWFTVNEKILFIYDSTNLTFRCNKSNKRCQEILQ